MNAYAFHFLKTFTVIIKLKGNVLRLLDPACRELLSRIRVEKHSMNDMEILNWRYKSPQNRDDLVHAQFKNDQKTGHSTYLLHVKLTKEGIL